jgi:hypothetical protein
MVECVEKLLEPLEGAEWTLHEREEPTAMGQPGAEVEMSVVVLARVLGEHV